MWSRAGWQNIRSATVAMHIDPGEVKGELHMGCRFQICRFSEPPADLRQKHTVVSRAGTDDSHVGTQIGC